MCWSLLSFLYLAALPFELFPWSFSRVSLTCFWTSSALGSSLADGEDLALLILAFWTGLWPGLNGGLCPGFAVSLGLLILLLFFLEWIEAGDSFFFSVLNFDKSIVSPVDLRPDNFLYWVVTVPGASSLTSSSGFLSLGAILGVSLVVSTDFSTGFSADFSTSDSLEVSKGLLIIGFSTLAVGFAFGVTTFISVLTLTGFKTILPTFLISLILEAAVIILASSSFFLSSSSISASLFTLRASFSLDLASLSSFDATFLFASVWNSSDNRS